MEISIGADTQHALVVHILKVLRKGYPIKSHILETGKGLLWSEAASWVGHDILSDEFKESILLDGNRCQYCRE